MCPYNLWDIVLLFCLNSFFLFINGVVSEIMILLLFLPYIEFTWSGTSVFLLWLNSVLHLVLIQLSSCLVFIQMIGSIASVLSRWSTAVNEPVFQNLFLTCLTSCSTYNLEFFQCCLHWLDMPLQICICLTILNFSSSARHFTLEISLSGNMFCFSWSEVSAQMKAEHTNQRSDLLKVQLVLHQATFIK